MPENQAHGKIYEIHLALNTYKATEEEIKSISHTAAIDVPRRCNHLDGIDISIKVTCGDAIDMGDILRFYDEVSSGEPFHMTVVTLEQINPTTKKLKNVIEVDLTNSVNLLFGTATRAEIEEFVKYIKSIPPYGRTPEHQKTYKKMASLLKQKSGSWISFAAKVDSEKQRRVQGHFCKFSKFIQQYPEKVIAKSETGEFRGGKIPEEIPSTKRVRHNKPTPHSEPHSPPI